MTTDVDLGSPVYVFSGLLIELTLTCMVFSFLVLSNYVVTHTYQTKTESFGIVSCKTIAAQFKTNRCVYRTGNSAGVEFGLCSRAEVTAHGDRLLAPLLRVCIATRCSATPEMAEKDLLLRP